MSIKFNFINKNNDIKISSIDEILLSKNNPTFTVINNLNANLAEFVIQDTTSDLEMQKNIYYELLKNEGDLSDLVRLIKNFYQFNFINENEEILLVHNPDLDKFIVAEGNRRIMLLKIINNTFNFPSVDFFSPSLYENNTTEYISDYEHEIKIKEKIKNNYDEFKKILNLIKEKNIDWQIHYKVINIEESDKLWSLIFDKHITGRRPGMREWSRAKYFADILTFFPEGINKDDDDLSKFKKINREKDVVIKDFKDAQYVYACFYYYFNKSDITINFTDNEIINKLKNATRISALEKTHSYNKIRNLFIELFLNNDNDKFDNEYFNISYNTKNYRIEFESKKLSKSEFLSAIYNWWNNKIITTRPLNKKNVSIIVNDLNIIINDLKIHNILSKKDLWKINEFSISNDILEQIIEVNEQKYKNEPIILQRFKIANKINKLNDLIFDRINYLNKNLWKKYENTPIYVLNIFTKQMQYNAPREYYNAVFISVRSFFEFLIIFISYFVEDNDEEKDKIIDCIAEGKEMDSRRKEIYKKKYIKNENIPYIANRKKFLKILFGDNQEKLDIEKKFDDYLWNSEKWNSLNSSIHAFHKLYTIHNYTKIYEEFSEYEELLLSILKYGQWDKFDELNDQIYNKINSINKSTFE